MLSFMCMIRAIDTCFCAQLYDAKSQDFPGLFSNRSATPIFFHASYHPPTTYPALRESCDFFISASHKTAICYIRTVLAPFRQVLAPAAVEIQDDAPAICYVTTVLVFTTNDQPESRCFLS